MRAQRERAPRKRERNRLAVSWVEQPRLALNSNKKEKAQAQARRKCLSIGNRNFSWHACRVVIVCVCVELCVRMRQFSIRKARWGREGVVLVARKLPDGLRILFFLGAVFVRLHRACNDCGIITPWGGMARWIGRVVWQLFVRCGCWFCLSFKYEINEPSSRQATCVCFPSAFSLWIL